MNELTLSNKEKLRIHSIYPIKGKSTLASKVQCITSLESNIRNEEMLIFNESLKLKAQTFPYF